jgi:hypothetical protein
MKLFAFLILFPFYSFAQNCGPINYLTAKDSPFDKIPVIDQDGAGICYAVAAAQLMNYHLIKTKQTTDAVVHPAWVALKSSHKVLDGGFEDDAINKTQAAGICEASKVEDALNAFGSDSGIRGNVLVDFIDTFSKALSENSQKKMTNAWEEAYSTAIKEASPYCTEDYDWPKIEPKVASLKGTSVQIFNHIFADQCSKNNLQHYKMPKAVFHLVMADEDAPAKLALLRNGPITIGYCATAWEHPEYEGQASPRSDKDADKDCGNHASVVVGRKMIGNTCNYLVRNSYGTGWGDWNENRKCICRNRVTLAWVDECTVDKQSSAEYTVEACYMSKKQLERNLTGVTTL